MKVNKIIECEWTTDLGCCIKLPVVEGCAVVVQVGKQESALSAIIHESVHAWQFIMEYMGEEDPGIETEAYTIECIVKELVLQYQELTGDQCAFHAKSKRKICKGLQKRSGPIHIKAVSSEEARGAE